MSTTTITPAASQFMFTELISKTQGKTQAEGIWKESLERKIYGSRKRRMNII
jgi:hypothetical protein